MLHKKDCKKFNGYKPCSPGLLCQDCKEYAPVGKRILLVNLDAQGDVLRTTAILNPIKRKYPSSFIVWLTDKSALPLLEGNPLIDRVYPYSFETLLPLQCERFDVLMNADKTRRSASVANLINAETKLGFGLTLTGAINPLNKEAEYLYRLGLDDNEKFKVNKKAEQQLLCEAFGLEYKRDEYVLNLTGQEKEFAKKYRIDAGLREGDKLIGFNTGCSNLFPYKKLPLEKQIELVGLLLKFTDTAKIGLLGGREDSENNSLLKKHFSDERRVIATPTDMGLRKGILFINACDLVVSGDTLGMHIAIALKKVVVAWFGLTCDHEIDLYDRGVKIVSRIDCRPCWKKECSNSPRCNEVIDIGNICDSAKKLIV